MGHSREWDSAGWLELACDCLLDGSCDERARQAQLPGKGPPKLLPLLRATSPASSSDTDSYLCRRYGKGQR
ncbi:GD23458 [Drosophila simulans]|uniref:GD23458 n=1 Tax=Drosophila simulans TaxID=7240 RepID=B4Q5E3_DROSI|nr:GD23458 [Drosophila simulans]